VAPNRRQPQNPQEELEQQNRDMLYALDELRQRKNDLELADQRKNEFVAMLAHELRNPLAAISMSVEVMRRKKNLSMAEVEKYRDTIGRQATQLTKLVNDLMDVSRVSRGKVELERSVVDVGSLVFEAIEMTRAFVDAKQHRLVVPPPGEPTWVDVDLVRMKQVISNLVHNAARYTPPGGLIEIGITAADALVHISVRDNGIGIDAQMLPKIFELFTQAPNSLAREDVGLGIGLTIVQRMAADHGGKVSAHSPGLGCGSEFVLSLPTVAPPATVPAVTPASAPAPEIAATQRRLLLVDDNADALRAMAELCQLYGYVCTVASDGPEGLAGAGRLRRGGGAASALRRRHQVDRDERLLGPRDAAACGAGGLQRLPGQTDRLSRLAETAAEAADRGRCPPLTPLLEAAALTPVNILYVEDNTDLRNLVLELIESESRRVVACADAEAAWQHLQRQAFDVLVTDVNLPGSSGTELATRWLEGEATRWVILFSGYDFRSGVASLGSNVRAVAKEDFEQLDQVLKEIGEHLQHHAASNG
jgi:CheY-like chemotaxis protein